MERVGVRDLRRSIATMLQRAHDGERVIVTLDGVPVAQIGPLDARGAPTLDDLAAAGLVRLPHRDDRPDPPAPFDVPVDVRAAAVMADLRGEGGPR